MKIKDIILKAFFPTRCVGCNTLTENGADLCENCRKLLCEVAIDQQNACRLCGLPKKLCTCKKHAREFEAMVSPFMYEGIIRNAVREIKNHSNCQPVDFFARHIASAVIKAGFENIDAVTAVPTTKKELRSRGYSPAKLIGIAVAKRLGLPFDGDLIRKVYETRPQKELPKFMRRGNIFGVFDAYKETAENKIILIIDDVTTTGSTLNECAKMLNFCGAFKVYCAVAAKTVLRPKETEESERDKIEAEQEAEQAIEQETQAEENFRAAQANREQNARDDRNDNYDRDENLDREDERDFDNDLDGYEYSPEEFEYIKEQFNPDRDDLEEVPSGLSDLEFTDENGDSENQNQNERDE